MIGIKIYGTNVGSRRIDFIVNGEPHGKGRPRFAKRGNFVKTYTDKDTELYENRVMMCYKEALKECDFDDFDENELLFPKGKPISMIIKCFFPLNKSDYGKKGLNKSGREKLDQYFCTKKPDIDNIIKSIQDGLNGVAYYDDSQIVDIEAVKVYTKKQPRVKITIMDFITIPVEELKEY